MSNQKLQSDSFGGLRYRGSSLGLPSVSRFRSGHMPSGMSVSRVVDNLSESDMDVSDSEDERYGARYSLESSPQDDKVPNGGSKNDAFVNARGGDAFPGNFSERMGGRGVGFSAAHRGFVYDDSSESVTSSEVNSTPPRGNNGILRERKSNTGANFTGTSMQPNNDSVQQVWEFSTLQVSCSRVVCCSSEGSYLERTLITCSNIFWKLELL